MEFPVDLLVSGRHEDLECSAQSYMNKLLYSNPDHTQYLTLHSTRKVQISPANAGFVPLYGANLRHKVLALFAPEDQFTAVALFLADQWYAVEDILRTSDPAREGLIKVRSVGERIVLYILNRIIYRTQEMGSNEVPFLCHAEDDYTKILWKNGEAVGFYSVKTKGSLCNTFVSQCYLLPVLDSIFVRKNHRGNGHGLQMLEDFVDSFKDDELGLKYPLTQAMQKICRRYVSTYPGDADLLWEVEGAGGPYQRAKVSSRLASLALGCNHGPRVAEENKNGEVLNEVEMNEESCLDITKELVAVKKHLKVAEERVELPVSTLTRSSDRRQKKRLREEPDEPAGENPPEKINSSLKLFKSEQKSAKGETEVEPEAVVPWTKVTADEETKGEQVEETTPIQVDEIMATKDSDQETEPEHVVNGEIKDSQTEKEEGSTDTAEDVQSGQECSLEVTPLSQNGTAEEEMEEEFQSQMAAVENDVTGNPEESEEPTPVVELVNQEPVSECKHEAVEKEREQEEVPSAVEENPVETVAGSDEEDQEREVTPEVEEKPVEAVTPSIEDEPDIEVTPAVEEEKEEDVNPTVQQDQDKEMDSAIEDKKNVDQSKEVSEVPSEVQVLPAGVNEGECVSSVQDCETLEDLSLSHFDTSSEEESGAPVEQREEEEVIMDTTVNQNETASDVPPTDEDDAKQETNKQDEQNEEDNTTTTDDEKEGHGSWDEASGSPDVRVFRGGRSKPIPLTPKRTSSRLNKTAIIEEVEEEPEVEEEEEKLTRAEEEKGSTEEDEAPEHDSEGEEQPPVIDRRVLRRKTKVIQSRPKTKRRSKN